MKDKRFRTVEEQKDLILGLSTDTQTPYEDSQLMFYQILYDIDNHITGDEETKLNIKRVIFSDITQFGMALTNIRFHGDKHPELKDEVRTMCQRIIEIASQLVVERDQEK
ncbi:MAG: hypothetical protein ACP5N7_00880 [Candidatus Pacearchaeota archaeon]